MRCYCFFFFKQNTAYVLRISCWSSDVCSSDLARQRAGERHALLLAAGELSRPAVGVAGELHQGEHLLDPLGALLPGAAQHFQPEADVLSYRQVGEQRVALEHRVDRSLERRQAAQRAALQEDLAAARLFETADQPQQRGLAAARGAQQREELVLADREGNVVEGVNRLFTGAEGLRDRKSTRLNSSH